MFEGEDLGAPFADYASMRGGVPWISRPPRDPNRPALYYPSQFSAPPAPESDGIGYDVAGLTAMQREYLTLTRPDLLRPRPVRRTFLTRLREFFRV